MSTLTETTDAAANASTSYAMEAGDEFFGSVDAATSDWVAVTLTAGSTYSIGVVGLGALGTGLTDPLLILHDADGNTIGISDNDGPGRFASSTVTVAQSGTYYVEVSNLHGSTGN